MQEVAPGVHVLRYPVLDVNATLIVGEELAVLVDTLGTTAQARDLLAAVRAVTRLPLAVVNTHAHFDHCFGNAVFAADTPGVAVWAHESTVESLRDHPGRALRGAVDEARDLIPEIADEVATVQLYAPDRPVHDSSTLDIGGRVVELRYGGRGHTDGDLVVVVPDAAVMVAGDLVEEGSPPSFTDSYPLDWPDTVSALLQYEPLVVVPGHGAVVDAEYVRAQRADLSKLEWLIRDGHRDGATEQSVAQAAPFGPEVAAVAVRRGYAELSGRI